MQHGTHVEHGRNPAWYVDSHFVRYLVFFRRPESQEVESLRLKTTKVDFHWKGILLSALDELSHMFLVLFCVDAFLRGPNRVLGGAGCGHLGWVLSLMQSGWSADLGSLMQGFRSRLTHSGPQI